MQSNEKESDALTAAFTESGKALGPEVALKRFLVNTNELIEVDKRHFTEELFSDVFALMESGHAISSSIEQGDSSPVVDHSFAIVSAVAAIGLMSSINMQRAAKEDEYRKGLKMFTAFEKDKNNPDHGEEKEDRKQVAVANLSEKMKHSGLQFVNLPNNDSRFKKNEYLEIARKKGIGEPIAAATVNRCGDFLKKPFTEKLEVTGEALSYLAYKGQKGVAFIMNVMSEYAQNPFRTHKIMRDTASGYKEGAILLSEMKERRNKHNPKEDVENKPDESQHPQRVTLNELKNIRLVGMQKTSIELSEQDRENLQIKLDDIAKHERAAKVAGTSLIVQSLFEVCQIIQGGINIASKGDVSAAAPNIYSFFAAMGPLKGFADELKSERAKANSKAAKAAEHIGEILNMHRQDVEDIEDGIEPEEAHPDEHAPDSGASPKQDDTEPL
ncbi:MAG: hypothetical protein ACRBCK_10280 [Alphaproteobacteria bacterium]